jgi:hypothetical protein
MSQRFVVSHLGVPCLAFLPSYLSNSFLTGAAGRARTGLPITLLAITLLAITLLAKVTSQV